VAGEDDLITALSEELAKKNVLLMLLQNQPRISFRHDG